MTAARHTARNDDYALQTESISKHFGAVRAVDELTLSIPRQGTTSIVGPQRVRQVNAGQPAQRRAPP